MSRKWLIVLLVICLSVIVTPVKALENDVYYTNDLGVEFTEDEYNFFTEFYYDGFQAYMPQSLKNDFSDIDFTNTEVTKIGYCQRNRTRDYGYSDEYRSIEIGSACGILCNLGTTVTWLVEPYTKSYDVIGYNLFGPTRTSTPTTIIVGDGSSEFAVVTKYDTDGFGAVVQLPDAQNISITQTFKYTGSGYVLSSYNHALAPISLTNAQKFNIDIGGFSGVFDFYGPAVDIYDEYPAVDLTV